MTFFSSKYRGKANDLTDQLWEQVVANGSQKKPIRVKVHPEDEAMIMYTSGSTCFPKGNDVFKSRHQNLLF